MERSNQPPKPECCLVEGQGKVRRKDPTRTAAGKRTQGKARAASGSRVLLKQFSFDTAQNAGGDGVRKSEPKTDETATGEVLDGLPGSESVAREEENAWNWGGPEISRRTNCEGQAGKAAQRQEVSSDGFQEFGSVHSGQRQGRSSEAGKGTDAIALSVAEISTV